MEDYQQIEKELVETLGTEDTTGQVTYYGVTGVLRGVLTAVSLKIRDLYYSITQITRKLFVDTCIDSDLDSYTADHGVPERKGATKAGTIIVFKGALGIVIPQSTLVKHAVTNLAYATVSEITLGTKNPDFVKSNGEIVNDAFGLADSVWAECVEVGTIGNCPQSVITKCSITGVTAENATPAQGGKNIETDEELRDRNKNYVKLLNQGTVPFYEALARNSDDRILRAYPYKNYSQPDTHNIVLVTGSGAALSGRAGLPIISGDIAKNCRAFTNIICENIEFTPIKVEYRVTLKSVNNQPIDLDKYFVDVSDAIARYIDWSKWGWGQPVSLSDILSICLDVPQTDDIDLLTFRVYSGVIPTNSPITLVAEKSLPYFAYLKIAATNIPEQVNINPRINSQIIQNYEALLLQQQQNQS